MYRSSSSLFIMLEKRLLINHPNAVSLPGRLLQSRNEAVFPLLKKVIEGALEDVVAHLFVTVFGDPA